jgi:hypothetical protein
MQRTQPEQIQSAVPHKADLNEVRRYFTEGPEPEVRCLPSVSHQALTGVASRDVGELAFERHGR